MFNSIVRYSFLSVLIASTTWGQLHLLAGSPHEEWIEPYAAGLFRIEDDGAVKLVSELVPKSPGAGWINISYDLRTALIVAIGPTIIVVDFDKAAVVKKCTSSDDPGGRRNIGEQWLANSSTHGPSFEWIATASDVKDAVVRGMRLDPSVPCEASFENRPPEAIREVLEHGDAGVGDVADNGRLGIVVGSKGWLSPGQVYGFVSKHVPLGYTIPPGIESDNLYSSLAISDSKVFCIRLVNEREDYRVLVFRKSDKTWHVLRTPSEVVPDLRGFGRHIAVTEANAKSAKNPKSAGSEKWRKGSRAMGPELAERMDDPQAGRVYPGKFHIYDVETEKLFPLTTNQADSEILLVENGMVYYRVLNQLFEAPLSAKGIGAARLLATDDVILDAHWAFMKR